MRHVLLAPLAAGASCALAIASCASQQGTTASVWNGDDAAESGDSTAQTGDGGAADDSSSASDGDAGDAGDAGAATPIEYVLVLVKENHTFDNYFTGFPGADTSTTAKLSDGKTIQRPMAPSGSLPSDLCHTNACGQTAYNGGAMDGFDQTGTGQLPFIYYSEQQIPNYWKYARNFVLADHFFSTTLGPSVPGHVVFWTAQSLVLGDPYCTTDGAGCNGSGCTAGPNTKVTAYDPDTCTKHETAPCFDVPILVDHLPKGFTWMDYGGKLALMVKSVVSTPGYSAHFKGESALLTDLTAGKIANLTIAHLWDGNTSEHPPDAPCPGENLTVQIVNAAMSLPQWSRMAIVITWDDWGGFYDHVAQPVQKCANGEIFENGFRLPIILVSPYARKGFVLKTPAEQASVPRLVEDLWGMSYMSTRDPHARDGKAGSLMGAFDFTQAPRPPMPLTTRTCP